ncbi:MAG: DinB family protein [Deinococcota bacterium]|nr:DUF664 domain-containing protein [Allomeiothermus silvanus]
MDQGLVLTYSWVRRTRAQVLDFCQGLPLEVYTREHPDFGFGSLRNLHAHVAECYLWWVGNVGLGNASLAVQGQDIPDVPAMRRLFDQVDATVEEAFQKFTRLDEVYEWTHPIRGWRMSVSQRWLLMHPITHEFHHKGQMMTLARIWGYTMPPETDTDLVPPTLG